MRPRQTLIEIFSSFLQFETDQVKGWIADPKLRRSMGYCLETSKSAETSEQFWALYWHAIWQTELSPIAKAHLVASLQEICYWAVKDTTIGYSSPQYRLSDFFQTAMERIDSILNGFNPKQNLSLKKYARVTFSNVIKDMLRLRQEIDICTDWSLLNKISQRRLIKSLQNAALPIDTIDRYVLAWTCFQACFAPSQSPTQASTRTLGTPSLDLWAAIAKLYNSERHHLMAAEPACTPDVLEKWLKACAKAVRSYLYPTTISLNAPKPGQEGEMQDDLPDREQMSLLAKVIAQEERSNGIRAEQINQVLIKALANLDFQLQQLLQLYYVQGLTQQQMAQQLDMKQYTVSRRLTKAKEQLLRALATWSREVLHISPTSDVLDYSSTILEEWLKAHYRPT